MSSVTIVAKLPYTDAHFCLDGTSGHCEWTSGGFWGWLRCGRGAQRDGEVWDVPGVKVVPRVSHSPTNDLDLTNFDLEVPHPSFCTETGHGHCAKLEQEQLSNTSL